MLPTPHQLNQTVNCLRVAPADPVTSTKEVVMDAGDQKTKLVVTGMIETPVAC